MGTEELGAVLRERRASQGLSQQALADRAGLSRNFVAQVERGESSPTVATPRSVTSFDMEPRSAGVCKIGA